ncbi:phasin family protein [Methyloceanibacter caenitepidi]|nr:phasin family protein [Methyloceanibacter caenitepidi]
MVDKSVFDLPTELRNLTEQCMKAQTSYGQLMHSVTHTMRAWPGLPSETMVAGFNEFQERAMDFAKENAESSFSLARELANAKDVQEVMSIQSRYGQTQIQAYSRQVQELGRLMVNAMSGAGRKI